MQSKHAWYVSKVLEHRYRWKRRALEFRVAWVGFRPNSRHNKRWHSVDIFKTEGVEGMLPGEVTCTLFDAKIAAYMKLHGI